MYFEPARKTYYRFPSLNSINDFDSRYYFPEKQHSTGEDTRFEAKSTTYASSQNDRMNA
jgi:hypothetical protein